MENFVTTSDQELRLHQKEFRSIGVNRYNLLSKFSNTNDTVCANHFSEAEISATFSQLHDMGVTSVRFWLFQKFTRSGQDLSRFDFVLNEADKYGIKVIPVFENHWKDCTEGGMKERSWYASGYNSPYGAYPVSLKEYIGRIVPKYKDNTAIMMWEIMNEARDADVKELYEFTTDISGYIKSLDPNHLVSLGMVGRDNSASEYEKISGIRTIDVLDYHDYNNDTNPLPDRLQDVMNESKKYDKPLFISESGIKNSVGNRAQLFKAKIDTYFKNRGVVYMIWSYGESYVTNDGYNFDAKDPLGQVVKQTAMEIE